MSPERRILLAKRACTRCSTQKKRCDKVLPGCGLCIRLHQACKYESSWISVAGPAPSPSSKPEVALRPVGFTPNHVRDTIVQRLEHLAPEDVISDYRQAVNPWFPVISITRLRSRIPSTWNDADLDIALLCLSIRLVATVPPSSFGDKAKENSDYRSLYLCTKSSVALTEGLGINSFYIIQSKILVTLFEVAHGLYPAAFISIGSTVRAADALETHPQADYLPSQPFNDEEKREQIALIWFGILVLDRYIAVESGSYPSLTRSRTDLHRILKPTLCPTNSTGEDLTSPICRFARVEEGTSLLDKIHNVLNSPMDDHVFDMDQLVMTVQALYNFQDIVKEETGDGLPLYTGGLGICHTALLLAFENGTKVPFISGVTEDCSLVATTSLITLISTIASTIEPFTVGTKSIDFNLLPPFVIFLVYKAAAIVTERLLINNDANNDGLRNLRILRKFLKIVGARWLSCERYLTLLNEDTTPRILKGIAEG